MRSPTHGCTGAGAETGCVGVALPDGLANATFSLRGSAGPHPAPRGDCLLRRLRLLANRPGPAPRGGRKQLRADQMKERWFFTMEGPNVVLRAQFEHDDGTVGDARD